MDGGCDVATHGSRSNDVRAHRHGNRSRAGVRVNEKIPTMGGHPVFGCLAHCQYHQYRFGFVRHGRCWTNANGRELALFCNYFFSVLITVAIIRFRYHQIADVLKWLCLVLFAYAITAFLVVTDWKLLLYDTFIPSWPHSHDAWSTLVAILGTTISPYLFFWQASQEVEEEKGQGERTLKQRQGTTAKELAIRRMDVGIGTFASNLVMFFIIVVTAVTLHKHGLTKIETSKQAAEALRPLAGEFAYLLYTVGIVGVGFLAIPVLAGSAAYALAETFSWHQGIDKHFKGARGFFTVIIFSASIGVLLNFLNVNPIKALYWTAIINGLLAPFLLIGILLVSSDKKIMRKQMPSKLSFILMVLVTLLMFGAGIGMFVF
jgi:Mn2+/Fe2+ NRAMP family transporter